MQFPDFFSSKNDNHCAMRVWSEPCNVLIHEIKAKQKDISDTIQLAHCIPKNASNIGVKNTLEIALNAWNCLPQLLYSNHCLQSIVDKTF